MPEPAPVMIAVLPLTEKGFCVMGVAAAMVGGSVFSEVIGL